MFGPGRFLPQALSQQTTIWGCASRTYLQKEWKRWFVMLHFLEGMSMSGCDRFLDML